MSAQCYSRADRARIRRQATPRCLWAVDLDHWIALMHAGDRSLAPYLAPVGRWQTIIPGTVDTRWRRPVSCRGRLSNGPDGPIR